MRFYDALQLDPALLKRKIADCGGRRQKAYYWAAMALRSVLIVAFAVGFISALSAVFGADNTPMAVALFCILLSVRFVNFEYCIGDSLLALAAVLAILVLALIAVVIIMNTIKLSVFTRRYEINIMKFVGATDWFIRWPFLIEGLLIGLIGAAIPMAVGWLVYDQALAAMTNAFPAIVNIVNFLYAVDIFGWLVPCSLVGGMALGIIGSVSSIRKHLKV